MNPLVLEKYSEKKRTGINGLFSVEKIIHFNNSRIFKKNIENKFSR